MEVQGAIVGFAAPHAGNGFLILSKPSPDLWPALSLPCLLASSAFVPPVSLTVDYSRNAEVFFGLLDFAVFAKLHRTYKPGPYRGRLRS